MHISSISFGKQAVMTCRIKDKANRNTNNAVLYKLNPMDENDRKDVMHSKQTVCISKDFLKEWIFPSSTDKEFYILQNKKTKEVISCAETKHKYRTPLLPNPGLSTLIEEASENSKYVNGAEPLFAYITKHADDHFDETVFTAFDDETIPSLKKSKFSETKTGEYFLPKTRFSTVINKAEKKYKTKYLD